MHEYLLRQIEISQADYEQALLNVGIAKGILQLARKLLEQEQPLTEPEPKSE